MFSDEDIIAFLLGEADESLADSIRQRLTRDTELVARISHFRSLLNHFDGVGELYEPPSGLVESTMRRMQEIQPDPSDPIDQVAGQLPADSNQSANPSPAKTSGKHAVVLSGDSVHHQIAVRKESGWTDSLALSVSLIAMCSLLLPTMIGVRFESRRHQCADNLRRNGQALIQFALRNPDHRFPAVARSGPEAFSGIYAVRLKEVGLLNSSDQLFCVSINGFDGRISRYFTRLPSLQELHAASPRRLATWKQVLGGDYAYNLGVMESQRLVAPKNIGRSQFAILADAPLISDEGEMLLAHDGRGVNILYDDGHVEFICRKRLEQPEQLRDHPFFNHHGDHEAGLDDQDASLAPSFFPPLGR
jgi:prepilin-type processing-associated H-X9-DG protein